MAVAGAALPLPRHRRKAQPMAKRLALGERYLAQLDRHPPQARPPVEDHAPVIEAAPWYRVGPGITTCPHLAARWALATGLAVELLGDDRQTVVGVGSLAE